MPRLSPVTLDKAECTHGKVFRAISSYGTRSRGNLHRHISAPDDGRRSPAIPLENNTRPWMASASESPVDTFLNDIMYAFENEFDVLYVHE